MLSTSLSKSLVSKHIGPAQAAIMTCSREMCPSQQQEAWLLKTIELMALVTC